MFDSEFCKIEYLEKYNAVFCQWKKFCRSQDYRKPLEFGLKLIHEKGATVWITDTVNGFENEEEDTQWLLENFIPKTIDSTCDTVIFILSPDSQLQHEIQMQSQALSQYFNVKQIDTLENLDD